MSQLTSKLFSLAGQDWLKSFLTAAFVAVLTSLYAAAQAPDFSFALINWHLVLQVAITAGVGDLLRRFGTDANGKFLGAIG